jgi:hypothetical protein
MTGRLRHHDEAALSDFPTYRPLRERFETESAPIIDLFLRIRKVMRRRAFRQSVRKPSLKALMNALTTGALVAGAPMMRTGKGAAESRAASFGPRQPVRWRGAPAAASRPRYRQFDESGR